MPHDRERLALVKIKKKLKFARVVTIQGARQVGKSFLAREILKKKYRNSQYISLDLVDQKEFAQKNPRSFILQNRKHKPLIIDEAQKAPDLFDTIKYIVDEHTEPGQFVLLGSTEFSILSQIRESLTGRMSKMRIFPLNLFETKKYSAKITREDIENYLIRGGLPGVAFVRSNEERGQLFQDWCDLICQRDIHQFKKYKYNSDTAFSILKCAATLEEPTARNICKYIKKNIRVVLKHIQALEELFVLIKLETHKSSYGGKSIYLPFDCGVAHFLGANRERLIHICLLNELNCKNNYKNEKYSRFYYYRSSGKNMVHLVEESSNGNLTAHYILPDEKIDQREIEKILGFIKKNKNATGVVYAPVTHSIAIKAVDIQPLENMAVVDY